MKTVTQKRLKELMFYQDGKLFWKRPTAFWMKMNTEAGYTKKKTGYRMVCVDGKDIMAHRLVFLYHHGYFPEIVDHIDGDVTNNNIENLRPATRAQNNQNARLRKDNKTGQKGVRWREDQKKWHATIKADKKAHHLGYFEAFEDAKNAYLRAAQQLHGEFATKRGKETK
jgi:HNH endonuclease/AP2 domain